MSCGLQDREVCISGSFLLINSLIHFNDGYIRPEDSPAAGRAQVRGSRLPYP